MKNKKILLVSILFILFFVLFSQISAVIGPRLVVNDTLKKCGQYQVQSLELKKGWHIVNENIGWENWSNYCQSLGYTFSWDYKTERSNIIFDNIYAYLAILLIVIIIYFFIKYLSKIRRNKNIEKK